MPLPQLIEGAHSAVRVGKDDVIARARTRRTASTMRRRQRRQNEITESLSGRTGILIWSRPHYISEIAPTFNCGRTCNAGSVEASGNAGGGRRRERRRIDRSLARAQAVATSSACCKPSNSIAWTRITYFWTLPVTVIGNSSTT